jgi:hypothetical protein
VASPSSSTEIPEINDKYPGINGKTHGEMNDIIPAVNAINRLTCAPESMYTPPGIWFYLILPQLATFKQNSSKFCLKVQKKNIAYKFGVIKQLVCPKGG